MVDIDWSDYGLKRLFNPDSCEYLPIEDQLKQYKTRDLQRSKVFATVTKIWGATKTRRRIFIASSSNQDEQGVSRTNLTTTSPLKPTIKQPQKERNAAAFQERSNLSKQDTHSLHQEDNLTMKVTEYKEWLKMRMKLREDLDNMGLKEKWLLAKPELTVLEKRVLERIMKQKEFQKVEKDDNHVESVTVPRLSPPPTLVHDAPEGVQIISQHLAERRLRAVDLFTQADKDKSWSITRQEFRNCIKERGIRISDGVLEELINTLDKDANEEIDFKEFVKGMKSYKLQERKKLVISNEEDSQSFQRPVQSKRSSRVASAVSETSQHSTSATSDSSYLSLPSIDITERRELSPDDMIEKRKRERHSAKGTRRRHRGVDKIKTGNRFVDNHSLKSTLVEEPSAGIDRFREARLKDYFKLTKLCKEKDIILSQNLLERALLYPGDKPHRRIQSRICVPGPGLLSSQFADPSAPPENPDDDLDFNKVFYGDNGEPMMEVKHSFPMSVDVRPEPEVQNLSTGRAVIRSKVNSWLTFEDYVRLTNHLSKRYVRLREKTEKADPFWPGYLLDKVRLCMDHQTLQPTNSIFHTNRRPTRTVYPCSYNQDKWWPISDQGYMKPADIESNKCYNIDWK